LTKNLGKGRGRRDAVRRTRRAELLRSLPGVHQSILSSRSRRGVADTPGGGVNLSFSCHHVLDRLLLERYGGKVGRGLALRPSRRREHLSARNLYLPRSPGSRAHRSLAKLPKCQPRPKMLRKVRVGAPMREGNPHARRGGPESEQTGKPRSGEHRSFWGWKYGFRNNPMQAAKTGLFYSDRYPRFKDRL
jgi:hypothetical protein